MLNQFLGSGPLEHPIDESLACTVSHAELLPGPPYVEIRLCGGYTPQAYSSKKIQYCHRVSLDLGSVYGVLPYKEVPQTYSLCLCSLYFVIPTGVSKGKFGYPQKQNYEHLRNFQA